MKTRLARYRVRLRISSPAGRSEIHLQALTDARAVEVLKDLPPTAGRSTFVFGWKGSSLNELKYQHGTQYMRSVK